MDLEEKIVTVWPIAGFDRDLHYRVSKNMATSINVGCVVRVPLGRRFALGLVIEVDSEPDLPLSRLKLISQVLYEGPVMTRSLIRLATWMKSYYGAKRDSVLECMIPSPVRQGMSPKQETLLEATRKLEADEFSLLEKRAPKQAALYQFVSQQLQPQKKSDLLNRLGITAAAATGLIKKGFLKETRRPVQRVAYDDDLAGAEFAAEKPVQLNAEQKSGVASISKSMEAGKYASHLLKGVTGSGKTEVYFAAMEKALENGQGVLFLVPEVALTPQTVGRLRSRLARIGREQAVVWHSHLSDGERFDAWMALANGKARVVVGARSAVFAPISNLGLIIVDEEHEPAYKQDETPRYHGRDVAVYRARLENAVCVLGSATPSLESYKNAQTGKYILNTLNNRVDDRRLPMIHIVDMRAEIMRSRKPTQLSSLLVEKLQQRFDDGEQSILFINRRGFSSSMICQECGYVAECAHCSVSMTYHRTDETLKCHLCGDEQAAPLRCPECRSPKIRWKGSGTQRVEDAVQKALPKARISRIDADAMSRKHLFRERLSDFRTGKIDVLVGTQMIGKGLDFPNVTLVGLVDADLTLHLPDFRANERAFQLLVQVSGRAGRGEVEGEVIVQTFTPHADPIQFARHSDVDTFLELESESRERFAYPPYRHLIRQLLRGPNSDKVSFFAEQFARRAEQALPGVVELRGPTPCVVEKMKDHYRFQIWYFTKNVTRVMADLRSIYDEINWPDDVISVFDVDPMSLM